MDKLPDIPRTWFQLLAMALAVYLTCHMSDSILVSKLIDFAISGPTVPVLVIPE